VDVHIDETGRNDQTGDVKGLGTCSDMRFNTRDVTALDEQIGYFIAVVGRVDDATVFKQEIGH
jgi:hypothetical protein